MGAREVIAPQFFPAHFREKDVKYLDRKRALRTTYSMQFGVSMDSGVIVVKRNINGITRRRFMTGGICAGAAFCLGGGAVYSRENITAEYPSGPKEARFYDKLRNGTVQCRVCPRQCTMRDGEHGFCGTRENRSGKLYSLVYGRISAQQVDPIEKKPLFHFLPGSTAYSIATVGCNLTCKFCQNYQISQAKPAEYPLEIIPPDQAVATSIDSRAQSIAFTYNEPTVFTEYVYDCSAAAKKKGIRSVVISNGFINPAPVERLSEVISAYKVDFKAFSQSFYREVTGGDREPVLNTIKLLKKLGVWMELVHLTIPTLNDSESDFKAMGDWLMGEVGPDVPVHFTRFSPMYRLTNLPVTPVSTLEKARDILRGRGMHFVYIGNVPGHQAESTSCPKCGKVIVERIGYSVREIKIKKGACSFCGTSIPGVWA
jgi:pyruvate formate lyase activating enzyme